MPASYTERLWPGVGTWIATAGFGGIFGIVVAPIDNRLGVATAVAAAVLLLLVLTAAAPRIRVTAGEFVAGRARIPTGLLGEVEVLDRSAMRSARGRSLDARAYLCAPGWLRQGVRIRLTDPADPTPYWLVGSRRPAALAAALTAAGAGSAERVGEC